MGEDRMYQLPSTPPAVDPLGAQVVVRPGDTLLVGLPPAANGLVAAAQARELEALPDRIPGVDVVLLRGVTSLGVVQYAEHDGENDGENGGENGGEDQAHELVAARDELARVRVAAQQRVDDLVAEHGRQLAALGHQVRDWITLVAAALPGVPTVGTAEASAALKSMRRIADDLDGGRRG